VSDHLELLPAVDVAGGQAVQLVQGVAGSEKRFGDPLEAALRWQEAGAEWIHLVDLDAAFGRGSNLGIIKKVIRQAKGVNVTKKLSIGSREAYFPGLQDGSIDLIPEYTGVLLQYLNKSATETEPDAVYAALQKALPGTLTVLEKSSAEDKDAVVVTKDTATKYNATSIADLAANCGQLTFGGPPEFKTRPDGIPGLQKTYNCTFKDYKALDAGGPLTVAALKNGDVQAADIFSTDASIWSVSSGFSSDSWKALTPTMILRRASTSRW